MAGRLLRGADGHIPNHMIPAIKGTGKHIAAHAGRSPVNSLEVDVAGQNNILALKGLVNINRRRKRPQLGGRGDLIGVGFRAGAAGENGGICLTVAAGITAFRLGEQNLQRTFGSALCIRVAALCRGNLLVAQSLPANRVQFITVQRVGQLHSGNLCNYAVPDDCPQDDCLLIAVVQKITSVVYAVCVNGLDLGALNRHIGNLRGLRAHCHNAVPHHPLFQGSSFSTSAGNAEKLPFS